MKIRKLLLFFFVIIPLFSFSQNTSFGIVLNSFAYDVAVKNGNQIGGEVTKVPFGIGGFFDYNFKDNLGLKTDVLFVSASEGYYFNFNSDFDVNQKSLTVSPRLKFDVRNDYNQGFYITSGARMSFILSSETNDGIVLDNFYNTFQLGAQFGFGFRFLKIMGFELIGDYGLTDILKDENQVKTAGILGNLTIDSFFNK